MIDKSYQCRRNDREKLSRPRQAKRLAKRQQKAESKRSFMKSFSLHSQTPPKAQHARIIDPIQAEQSQAEQRAKQFS